MSSGAETVLSRVSGQFVKFDRSVDDRPQRMLSYVIIEIRLTSANCVFNP